MSEIARVTLNGVADTALGIVLLPNYDEPMLSRPRERFVRIAGRQGRREFDGDVGVRLIRLRFAIVDATTQAGLAVLIRNIAEILLDDDGVPTDVTIVFAKEPTKTYTGRYAGDIRINRIIAGTVGQFTLPMRVYDPFAYEARVTTIETITTDPQTVDVSNAGDYTTPPVMSFYNAGGASVSGFTLQNRQEKI